MSITTVDGRLEVRLPYRFIPDAWCEKIDGQGNEEGATVDNMDPSRPFLVLDKYDWDKIDEWVDLKSAWVAKQIPNDIIIPDPTPQTVRDDFFKLLPHLNGVLIKDSVRCFLALLVRCTTIMVYRSSITSETLTFIIRHNALRCAKVVLEGKAPELGSKHANPNCMNPEGCFPLHEAAERFSVDMIKLLFRHGASANVCTASGSRILGLLPVHVAVENASMHKYLEDNLSPLQHHEDYIYKLIHLLCLPEMKVFLDTVRLLAEKTDNLVDEVWNYMKNDKLVQTAVLLLAAQKHLHKIKPDGFHIIMQHLIKEHSSLRCDRGDTGVAQKQLEEKETFLSCKFQISSIILLAGEVLDKYIQAHSEVSQVSHVEVFARVSSILKEFGFCPKEEYSDNISLYPYIHGIPYSNIFHKGHGTKAAAEKKAVGKNALQGWDPTYTRRKFFPYWRSVLGDYPAMFLKSKLDPPLHNSSSNEASIRNGGNIGFLGGIQQLTCTHQPRRYSTAAFKMLTKVLKNA